jgi:hypothetical protein
MVCKPEPAGSLQIAFEAVASFEGKRMPPHCGRVIRMFVGGLPQEANLSPVPATPSANQQMQLQPNISAHGQRMIHRFRLRASRCATIEKAQNVI